MRVDVVIATYNRADTLRETIKNVLTSAYGLTKLYVVDNASTDHTKAVLESVADDRLIPVFNKKKSWRGWGKIGRAHV